MSNIIPTAITSANTNIDAPKFKFVTPFVDIYENTIDSINVVIDTSINHFSFEWSFSFGPFFLLINLFSPLSKIKFYLKYKKKRW